MFKLSLSIKITYLLTYLSKLCIWYSVSKSKIS